MKQILLLSLILILPFALFSQSKNIDGKWQLTSFNNNTSNLSMESNEYCFWCQLDIENKSFVITGSTLQATLNGETYLYNIKIENNQLILKKNQLVHIEYNGEKQPDKVVEGKTIFTFIRGGKKLTLINKLSDIKEVYTFSLIK